MRRATGPFRFEATAYYTRFNGFIFRQLTGVLCDETFDTCGNPDGELNQAVYSQRDAIFRGGEFQSQLDISPLWTGIWGVENQFDVVRATFTDGTNVPRIPPVRLGGGVFWRDANWLVRVNLLHAFAHTDVEVTPTFTETPTAGYNNLRAEISYRWRLKPATWGPHRSAARHCRQQPAQRRHPQLRLVHQGRGADAGPQRAGVRHRQVLIVAITGGACDSTGGRTGMGSRGDATRRTFS